MNRSREKRKFLFGKSPTDPGRSCRFYPCHFEGQDCTWCYCPLYPCRDPETKGKHVRSKKTGEYVWSCINCHWIHHKEAAEKLRMKILGGNRLPGEAQFADLLGTYKEFKRERSR
ncbi:hypothetical protein ISS96_00390 [Candidatus Bathyarchaeota archaeon]|nr:hypothetical protein [Candidatus Bathyarchaeota archaeon]